MEINNKQKVSKSMRELNIGRYANFQSGINNLNLIQKGIEDKPQLKYQNNISAQLNSNIVYEYAFVDKSNRADVLRPIQNFKIENIVTKDNHCFGNIESFLENHSPYKSKVGLPLAIENQDQFQYVLVKLCQKREAGSQPMDIHYEIRCLLYKAVHEKRIVV